MGGSVFYPLTISHVTPETDSAVRVGFVIPEALSDQFKFRSGQYLTLRTSIDGELVSRSYSICVPAESDALEVAVKRVDGGVFSNFANDRLVAGAELEVMPPQGNFCIDPSPGAKADYLFIAAGSGITPMMALMQSVLLNERGSTVTLIYGNQRTATIMFRQKLAFMKNQYMERFQWVNVLSREEQEAPVLNGRIDNKKGAQLQNGIIDIRRFDKFMLCGPESMISEVSRGLTELGIDDSSISYELFGSSAEDAQARVAKHHARSQTHARLLAQVTMISDGRSNTVAVAAAGENLLDAGLNLGLDLPYACKGGVCATCKALLVEGEVEMDIQRGLTEEEVRNGMILTCQAHPLSDNVVVDFDKRWAGH